jgi:hypothetical protein
MDRVKALKDIPYRGVVHKAKNYKWKDRKKAIKESLKHGGEGIVIKDLHGIYKWRGLGNSEPFGPSWKFKAPGKKANTADVILKNYRQGKEKLIFDAYQMHRGKYIKVGRLSGLDKNSEKKAKNLIDKRNRVVAEVSYQERLPSGKLRHMGWMRLRPDKPAKSATVRENPMEKPTLWFVVVDSPKRSTVDSSHEYPASAFMRQLEIEESGKECLILSEADIEVFKKATGKRIPKSRKKKGPSKNPRPSKVKNALSAEAIRYKDFEEFATRYWNSCARGIYWMPVDHHNFSIGDRERNLVRDGKFFMYCNPIVASEADLDVRYMAELNVNAMDPGSLQYVKGEDGTKIKVRSQADRIIVQRVIPVDKALRAFKYQLSLLPSSKDELLAFWDMAWEKEEARKKKEAEKAERRRRREERKREREAKKAAKKSSKKKRVKKAPKKSTKKKRTKKRGRRAA